MDIVFALTIAAWLAWTDWRGLRWFLPVPFLAAVTLLGYNLWFFDTILGGQANSSNFTGNFTVCRARGRVALSTGCSGPS